MKSFLRLFEVFADFLFPKSIKVLELEEQSPEKILSILPGAEILEDKGTIALFDYSHPLVREIIWNIKYKGDDKIADKMGEVLADTLVEEIAERNLGNLDAEPLLMPMPISDKRRFERGWNQSEIIAKAIRKHLPKDMLRYTNGQLVKHRHTESQTHTATKSERQKNLKGSMKLMDGELVRGRVVILVDDVVTTGSTFAEAKRVLKDAGARKVLCIAIAH